MQLKLQLQHNNLLLSMVCLGMNRKSRRMWLLSSVILYFHSISVSNCALLIFILWKGSCLVSRESSSSNTWPSCLKLQFLTCLFWSVWQSPACGRALPTKTVRSGPPLSAPDVSAGKGGPSVQWWSVSRWSADLWVSTHSQQVPCSWFSSGCRLKHILRFSLQSFDFFFILKLKNLTQKSTVTKEEHFFGDYRCGDFLSLSLTGEESIREVSGSLNVLVLVERPGSEVKNSGNALY